MPVHSLAGRPSPTVADSSGMPSWDGRSQRNRRRYRRILAPIHCRPAGVEFFAQHLAPINISLGGLRIHTDEQFRVGASLSLDIFFARIAAVTFTTEIMWIEALRECREGRFDVGLAFVDLNPATLNLLTDILKCEGESVGYAPPSLQKPHPPAELSLECSLGEQATELPRTASESGSVQRERAVHAMLVGTPVLLVNEAELRAASLDSRCGFLVSLIDGVTSVESLMDLSCMSAEETLALLGDLRQRRIVGLSW
jgi:hypothetical protein